ncbi:hypothetical protein [Salininema proteolyticum]|uniref:Uncharacterized protein n=1 Tax=Salininema proteolyticum TaxID=1607685 RepID=A0ABV8U136_9ACTN
MPPPPTHPDVRQALTKRNIDRPGNRLAGLTILWILTPLFAYLACNTLVLAYSALRGETWSWAPMWFAVYAVLGLTAVAFTALPVVAAHTAHQIGRTFSAVAYLVGSAASMGTAAWCLYRIPAW